MRWPIFRSLNVSLDGFGPGWPGTARVQVWGVYVLCMSVCSGHSLALVVCVAGPIGLLILVCGIIYLRVT